MSGHGPPRIEAERSGTRRPGEPQDGEPGIDDPRTTLQRSQALRRRKFLRSVYEEWYRELVARIPDGPGRVLEVGAGPGFLSELLPEVVSSDLLPLETVDLVLEASALAVRDGSLRAIVLTNVFHHIPDPAAFLRGAARAVRPGGALVMLEPWVTSFSRIVYGRLHHEPFDPRVQEWTFPKGGPLSAANPALPWIVFERDRDRLRREHPEWEAPEVATTMPFRYLVSGGFTAPTFVPAWSFAPLRWLESALGPLGRHLALFAYVTLKRAGAPAAPTA